jgi:hypothetical protein
MKRALFAVLLSLLTAGAFAQDPANFAYRYDVDAIDPLYEYCKVTGINNDPFGSRLNGRGTIENGGSSTDINGVNAADDSFLYVTVNDIISVQVGSVQYLLVVVTKTDNDNIIVDQAIDLSAATYQWGYYDQTCVTPEEPPEDEVSGWIDITRSTQPSHNSWMVNVEWEQGDATLLSAQIQCKTAAKGAKPVVVYPTSGDTCGQATANGSWCDFDTVGIAQRLGIVNLSSHWSLCRVALKVADDAEDDPANREIVTVSVVPR